MRGKNCVYLLLYFGLPYDIMLYLMSYGEISMARLIPQIDTR